MKQDSRPSHRVLYAASSERRAKEFFVSFVHAHKPSVFYERDKVCAVGDNFIMVRSFQCEEDVLPLRGQRFDEIVYLDQIQYGVKECLQAYCLRPKDFNPTVPAFFGARTG